MIALVPAVVFERKRRGGIEKPPQQEKLLRPPGYSLSLRLDETQEGAMKDILWACGLCGVAGASASTVATFLGANVPILWTILFTALFGVFAILVAWLGVLAFRRL